MDKLVDVDMIMKKKHIFPPEVIKIMKKKNEKSGRIANKIIHAIIVVVKIIGHVPVVRYVSVVHRKYLVHLY